MTTPPEFPVITPDRVQAITEVLQGGDPHNVSARLRAIEALEREQERISRIWVAFYQRTIERSAEEDTADD